MLRRRTIGLLLLLCSAACGTTSGPASPTPAAVATNQPPTIAAVTASASIGLQGATVFAFAVQASSATGDKLTYAWDFGDQGSATDAAPTHVYQTSGPFTVRVSVSDGKGSSTSQTIVTVKNLSGTWVFTRAVSGQSQLTVLTLTHTGSTLSGTYAGVAAVGGPKPVTGVVSSAAPAVKWLGDNLLGESPYTLHFTFTADVTSDLNSLTNITECEEDPNLFGPGTVTHCIPPGVPASFGPFIRQ